MADNEAKDAPNKISRKNMIKGAAATAVVSAGLLAACNEEKKVEQPAAIKAGACPGADHTGTLAVWLALTRSGHFSDVPGPDTWGDNGTTSDKVASQVATDMGLTTYQDQITTLVTNLRGPAPAGLKTMRDVYKAVANGLTNLSKAAYSGADCPTLYATLQSIARLCP
jgi:hypothetical protein